MYRKIGLCRVPRSRYIPDFALKIYLALGPTFDADVARIIRSLGNDRVKLKANLVFEIVLQLSDPKLDANEDLKFMFTVLLVDFLHMTGYVDVNPVLVEYVTDPVYSAEMLLDIMLGTRMPTFTASDLAGDLATIFNLATFFPEVIRRNALIINERPYMAGRFRLWLGNIGFKLMTTSSSSLSQAERSFLTIAGCTKQNAKGYISSVPGMKAVPIPPVENKDPLVIEVGALAVASCLPGPCLNHMKMISNGILEDLVLYYGPHVPDLKTHVGYMRKMGPFSLFIVSPEDSVPWMLESQITGITAAAANLTIRQANMPPFSIATPLLVYYKDQGGAICLYPDSPKFNLWLTDQTDISKFTWDYYSSWRGRRINSVTDGGTLEYALCDLGIETKTAGATQTEGFDLSDVGLCWLDASASPKIHDYNESILEWYILPTQNELKFTQINMTAYYARFGAIELLPAFSEYLELPLIWFKQPAERVVDFICSVQGLNLQKRVIFHDIITFCHNCARYKRLTKKAIPINMMRYVLTLLNEPTPTTETPNPE